MAAGVKLWGYMKHVLALPFPRQNSLAVDVSDINVPF
jgi:hypothetical protein